MSDLEQQRLANISRNRELLRKLNLDSLSSEIKKEVDEQKLADAKARGLKRQAKRRSKEPVVPQRKSRRLQGIKIEDTKEFQQSLAEQEKRQAELERLEKLKTMKLPGDISLVEVLKEQNGGKDDDKLLLESFSQLSDNFLVGDFYEVISKKKTNNEAIDGLRQEIGGLTLYEKFLPNEIQLTQDRVSYITFHPSNTEKIILGADIIGNVGIWNPGLDSDDDPAISMFSLHGKHIAKIAFSSTSLNSFYTASYDNSIRVTDLKSLKSTEILGLVDADGNDCGISDIQFASPNTTPEYANSVFFTTLTGQFGSFDQRLKPLSLNIQLYRLSDKKIGGFSINPNANYQVATGSLDRTLRIWDMRKTYSHSLWSEKFPEDQCLHSYGAYPSRLSVSSTDWNSSGDIVCNGYADQICIFNLQDTLSWASDHLYKPKKDQIIPETLAPNHIIKHNCRTGKWVTILKARWQVNPKDGYEKFVIGNMQKSFDVYTLDGTQVGHLSDGSLTAVPAACNFHQTENWLVGGTASGKCVLFS